LKKGRRIEALKKKGLLVRRPFSVLDESIYLINTIFLIAEYLRFQSIIDQPGYGQIL
jgi:hypothetical protein